MGGGHSPMGMLQGLKRRSAKCGAQTSKPCTQWGEYSHAGILQHLPPRLTRTTGVQGMQVMTFSVVYFRRPCHT